MVIFQIPAAAHVGRWGYRFFIATGWTVRLLFVLGLVFVPMLDGVLNSQSQLALVIVLLFAFNMIRGIASCAWFPWIRGLIPETIRGRYLTLERAFANAGQSGGVFAGGNLPGQIADEWAVHRAVCV